MNSQRQFGPRVSLYSGNEGLPSRRIAILLLTMAITLPAARSQKQSVLNLDSAREAAVAQARKGDPKGALTVLRGLLTQNANNGRLLADTAIIASWAGEDSYVLYLYNAASMPRDDFDVAAAAARAARNLHQYDRALELYRRAEKVHPDHWQARLGEAMVLTDKEDFKQAALLMQPLLSDHPRDIEVESGEAYLCAREGDLACVVEMEQRRSAQMPHMTAEVQDQLAQALTSLGANTLARTTYAGTDPQLTLRLVANLGAERVRWAEADRTWTKRKVDAADALSVLDQVIAATKPGEPLWRQAQADRLAALSDLNRAGDVVRSYENLQKMKTTVPDYALLRVADAYLTVHNPSRAESIYRSLADRMPHSYGIWSGLAYSQFEREHFRTAFATIDQAYRAAPIMLQAKGLRIPQSNKSKTDLGLQAAEMRGSAGLWSQEQRLLESSLAAAPANVALNRAMAKTYLARGWPIRAIRQEQIADSFEQPDDLPVIEDAEVLSRAGLRDRADTLLPRLLDHEGTNLPMVQYLRDRAVEHGWQADAHGGFEWSSGRFIGTNQFSEAHLYTPLIDNRWRIYIHGWGDHGNFQEGETWRSRGGLGLSYDYARQQFWVEAAADQNIAEARMGIEAGTNLSLGDHWTLAVKGDSDDLSQVQLIASLANIHARSINANLSWRQSDLTSVGAGLGRLLFTDGNQRTLISSSWQHRVWTAPRFQIDTSPQLWTSFNSKDENRIYFNPKKDFTAGVLATFSWITWRRYERNVTQQFEVYAAPYWQQNYGTGTAVNTSYEQHWAISHRLGAFGKFTWDSQPYDGSNEPYTDLTFGLSWGMQ